MPMDVDHRSEMLTVIKNKNSDLDGDDLEIWWIKLARCCFASISCRWRAVGHACRRARCEQRRLRRFQRRPACRYSEQCAAGTAQRCAAATSSGATTHCERMADSSWLCHRAWQGHLPHYLRETGRQHCCQVLQGPFTVSVCGPFVVWPQHR